MCLLMWMSHLLISRTIKIYKIARIYRNIFCLNKKLTTLLLSSSWPFLKVFSSLVRQCICSGDSSFHISIFPATFNKVYVVGKALSHLHLFFNSIWFWKCIGQISKSIFSLSVSHLTNIYLHARHYTKWWDRRSWMK